MRTFIILLFLYLLIFHPFSFGHKLGELGAYVCGRLEVVGQGIIEGKAKP